LIFFPPKQTIKSSDTMSETPELEIIRTAERFSKIDGVFAYRYVTVLFRLGTDFYTGSSDMRYRSKVEVKLEEVYDRVLIPDAHLTAPFPPNFTLAPDPIPQDCYLQKPCRLYYNPAKPTELGDELLEEATIHENLMRHPHPNIAKYYGCQVKDGRITGLCFAKYHETLMTRANPGHRGKRLFDATEHPLKDVKLCLDGIKSGIEHLHSLGLVHNALYPCTVRFLREDDDTPVIVGFLACRPIGHSLEHVGRALEWHDEEVVTSLPSNDTDGLEEIAEWLRNGKNFKFEMSC
jgi:serine/threonine protein kinase